MPRERFDSCTTHLLAALSGGTYTAQQLATMTGYDLYEIRDALAVLCGTARVEKDESPRFRLPSGQSVPCKVSPRDSLPLGTQVERTAPRAVGC